MIPMHRRFTKLLLSAVALMVGWGIVLGMIPFGFSAASKAFAPVVGGGLVDDGLPELPFPVQNVWFVHTGGDGIHVENPLKVIVGPLVAAADFVFRVAALPHHQGGAHDGEPAAIITLWQGQLPVTVDVPGGTLPPGDYDLVLQYVEDETVWELAKRPLTVFSSHVQAVFSLAEQSGHWVSESYRTGDNHRVIESYRVDDIYRVEDSRRAVDGISGMRGKLRLTADDALRDMVVRVQAVRDQVDPILLWEETASLAAGEAVDITFPLDERWLGWPYRLQISLESPVPVKLSEEIHVNEWVILAGGTLPSEDETLLRRWQRVLAAEGVVVTVLGEDDWVRAVQVDPTRFSGLLLPPFAKLRDEQRLKQSIDRFARRGGDLILLGESGITLAREDVGVALPLYSPMAPYELYDLKRSKRIVNAWNDGFADGFCGKMYRFPAWRNVFQGIFRGMRQSVTSIPTRPDLFRC